MKTYRVEIEVTYTQHIDVEADSMKEAEATALDQFDVDAAYQSGSHVLWVTDTESPSWLDQPLPAAPTQGESK